MKRHFGHTYEEIISVGNLLAAWEEFVVDKKNRTDVTVYARALLYNITTLHQDLTRFTYQHGGYERFSITDPKRRVIHKATVRDRVLHRAIYRILYPTFDATFIHDSYSCRVNKGTHRAVRQLVRYSRKVSKNMTGPCWALKMDVRKFFNSIDHKILLELLRNRLADPKLLDLLEVIITSFTSAPGRGLPLGNLTSQLFANVYLDPLDKFVKHRLRMRYYLRYADDFVILSQNKEELEAALEQIHAFLVRHLQLALHPAKIELRKFHQGIDFLGYVVLPHHVVLRTRTKRRMLRRVNELNLPSYLGLLHHCHGYTLTQWIIHSVGAVHVRYKNLLLD
ncbi:group II intron reverse transcriptase domain-containing protein [Candidatus Berkelbacteria bacterium]|nr:group II intron reverse transcriptase domain-containing protein [Candidatus Berkelbacteria bacterium]